MKEQINSMAKEIYENNKKAGWWTDLSYPTKVDKVAEAIEDRLSEYVTSMGAEILAKEVMGALNIHPTTETTRNVGEILCLIHSEISEAMEGHRKGLMDDKLPHRKMLEVELADAVIRILDLAGAHGMDLGGAMEEKLAYNKQREDHKIHNRLKDGGKAY